MKKFIGLTIPLFLLALVAFPAIAQSPFTTPPISGPTTFEQVWTMINNSRNLIYAIFLVLAVVFFVIAAFEYFTAGGDSTKLQTAKNRFMYGIVALIIVAFSVGMFTLIGNLLCKTAGTC